MVISEEIIEQFLQDLKFQDFRSDNTISSYKKDLSSFLEYLKQKHNGEISSNAIQEYLIYISKHRFLSSRSQNRAISSIRQFCRFLQTVKSMPNFAANVDSPKLPKTLPKAIDHNLLKQIIDAKLTTNSQNLAKTLLITAYATGLRVSELIKITLTDLENNNGQVLRVTGKGGKTRIVPLGNVASEVLANHINLIKKSETYKNSDKHFVFPSIKAGNNGEYSHISRQHAYKIIHALGLEFGVNISPHKLRHSFATELVKNNADLRMIQIMLGHSSITTTQIYTKVADEQAFNAVIKKHPLANL